MKSHSPGKHKVTESQKRGGTHCWCRQRDGGSWQDTKRETLSWTRIESLTSSRQDTWEGEGGHLGDGDSIGKGQEAWERRACSKKGSAVWLESGAYEAWEGLGTEDAPGEAEAVEPIMLRSRAGPGDLSNAFQQRLTAFPSGIAKSGHLPDFVNIAPLEHSYAPSFIYFPGLLWSLSWVTATETAWSPKPKYLLRTFIENICWLLRQKLDKGGKGSSVRKTRMIVQTSGEGR